MRTVIYSNSDLLVIHFHTVQFYDSRACLKGVLTFYSLIERESNSLPPPPPLPTAPSLTDITNNVSNVDHDNTRGSEHSQQQSKYNETQNRRTVDSTSSEPRYKPSKVLSEILHSSESSSQKNSTNQNGTIKNFQDDYPRGRDVTIETGYDSPPVRRDRYDSPVLSGTDYYSNSPRRNYREYSPSPHPSSHRGSPDPHHRSIFTEQGESPFTRLSESLRMLKRRDGVEHVTSNTVPSVAGDKPHAKELVEPNPDLKLVIDRLATYVAKNGDEFEDGIKDKNDPRFDFLNPWNMYHVYYIKSKREFKEQFEKEQKEGMLKFFW